MENKEQLLKNDPSRFVVYQMIEYFKEKIGADIVTQKTKNLFLIKTQPYIDSLYNYAHVLQKDLDESGIALMETFFQNAPFRVKTFQSPKIHQLFINSGFKLKDSSCNMENLSLLNQDLSFNLPEGVEIKEVSSPQELQSIKDIFAASFNHEVSDYNRKFGFFDSSILDRNNNHVGAFLLYENGQPVSSGTYYAFDYFSIENIGTLSSARKKGYAGMILKTLLQKAKSLEYTKACLVASELGISVYEKAGFSILDKNYTFIK